MKKVLIISYLFPPHQSMGAQRPYRLAKYFPEFGWEPIILTAKLPGKPPEGLRVIETEYKDLTGRLKSKFGYKPEKGLHGQLGIAVTKNFNYTTWKSSVVKLAKDVINYPDDKRGWYKFAVRSASEFLSKEGIDAIISTSPSPITHLIARKLKRKYGLPWIADFRDPWTQRYIFNKPGLIKYFEKRLESRTLYDADALVTVTDPYLERIKAFHKGKQIFCVTNGYDPDDFDKTPSKLTDKFTITYTGTLYNGRRDPSLLFSVATRLINENKINRDLIEIRLYTPREDWLIAEIKKCNLEGVVNVYDLVSRDEVLKRQGESQLLLLIRWSTKEERGDCPAKIYEYFGSKRPIVAIGGHGGIIEDLLEATNTGKFADNFETLKGTLLHYYEEFVKFGEVKCKSNKNIKNFSYNSIAKKYSKVLNSIIFH